MSSETAAAPVVIELHSDHAIFSEGGLRKTLNLADMLSLLNETIQTDANVSGQVSCFKLPAGAYMFGVSSNRMQISCYYPEARHTVKHLNRAGSSEREFNVPFPNVLIMFELTLVNSKWAVSSFKYMATHKSLAQVNGANPEYSNRQGYWTMPFPNFYGDGRMCVGGNTMSSGFDTDLRGLFQYYEVLHRSPFNDDLDILSIRNTHRGNSHRSWLELLATHQTFPYWLMNDSPVVRPTTQANSPAVPMSESDDEDDDS